MHDAPTITPDDVLLTLNQVAVRLGVSRVTALMWSYKGLFPVREVAGRRIVRETDLEAFIATREANTQ